MSNTLLASTESREISNLLNTYDHQDVKEMAQLCHVAYGVEESKYTSGLEEAGWDIVNLRNHDGYQYGIEANNGPLKVISFKGTDSYGHAVADLTAVRASTKVYFPDFPESVVHKGIFDYYEFLDPVEHFDHLDEDQFLVLSGHSLGGAVTNLAALDLIAMHDHNPHKFPEGFCSLLTLGAPPILGPELCEVLRLRFCRSAHTRFYFDNDPVALLTRGKSGKPHQINFVDDHHSVFQHASLCPDGVPLEGTGVLTHSSISYINHISSMVPDSVFAVWGTGSESRWGEPIHSMRMGRHNFHEGSEYLLSNYRSFDFSDDVQRALGKYLLTNNWTTKRNEVFDDPYFGKRLSDLLFYKIWRTEKLGTKELLDALLLLNRDFTFDNPRSYQNTFLYLERLMKKLGLTYSEIEKMNFGVDNSEVNKHDIQFDSEKVDPTLRVHFFLKKYLENRKEFYS